MIQNATVLGHTEFLSKFSHLEETISETLDLSGKKLDEVLQTDKVFIENFHFFKDHSLKTIFQLIPYLNSVSKIELTLYDCTEEENHNKSDELSTSVKSFSNSKPIMFVEPERQILNTKNIQHKITPWTPFEGRTEVQSNDLIVVATLIKKPANLGGLSRTCETFQVKRLVLDNANVVNVKEFMGLSMSSEKWIDVKEVKEKALSEYLLGLKELGYIVVGAEQTINSVPLQQFKFPVKSVLLLGFAMRYFTFYFCLLPLF